MEKMNNIKNNQQTSREMITVDGMKQVVASKRRKVNRYKYQKFTWILLGLLIVLLIPLLVTVSVKAAKSGINLIDPKLGQIDMKNKVFYPDFDDLDLVQKGFTYSKNEKPGLFYSKLFANATESLKEYSFKSGGNKRSIKNDFLELSSSTKKITFNVNAISSLNKIPRKVTLRVDWKNILFVHDENGKELFAIRRGRFSENQDRTAILSKSAEARKKIIPKTDLNIHKYLLAVTEKNDGEHNLIGKVIASTEYNVQVPLTDNELSQEITEATALRLVPKETTEDKASVIVSKLRKGVIEVIKLVEIKKGEKYTLDQETRAQAKDWYVSDSPIDKILPTTEKLDEYTIDKVTKTTYLIGSVSNKDKGVKINVSLYFQNENGQYLSDPTYSEVFKKTSGESYWSAEEIQNVNNLNITSYINNMDVPGINYGLYKFDKSKTLSNIPNIGKVVEFGDKYLFDFENEFKGEEANIPIYFARKKAQVKFKLRAENSPEMLVGSLPAQQEVIAGGKLPNPNPIIGNYKMTPDDAEKFAQFEGWATKDSEYANVIDLATYKFDDERLFQNDIPIELYAKWKKKTIAYVLRLQDEIGQFTEDGEREASSLKKVFEGQKVSFADIQQDINDRINVANLQDMYLADDREYSVSKNGGAWEVTTFGTKHRNENVLKLGVKLKRQMRTITLNTDKDIEGEIDDALEVSTDKKLLTYRYGFKPSKRPRLQNTGGKIFKGWKFGNTEFRFDGTQELTDNLTLEPILEGKFTIKYRLFLEDVNGNLVPDVTRDSNVKKSENEEVAHSELYGDVKSYVDTLEGFNSNTYQSLLQDGTPTNDPVTVTGDGTVLGFGFSRIEKEVTLNTDKPVTRVTDAKKVSDDNKRITYRYGYAPSVKPTIAETAQYKFLGWELDGTDYAFDGTKPLKGDITLTPKFEFKGTLVTINIPSNLVANNLRYEDSSVAIIKQTSTQIQLLVKNLPYTLKPLKYDGDAIDSTTGKKVRLKYSQQIINGDAVITVTLIVISGDFEGYYPQTLDTSVDPANTTEDTYTVNVGFTTMTYVVAHYNGNKYERINNLYYKYEKVDVENFPKNMVKPEKWTTKIIDVSMFNKKEGTCNVYGDSYIKAYLEEVMAKKMEIEDKSSIRLPMFDNEEELASASGYNITQTNVPVTDYAREVFGKYKAARAIPNEVIFHNPNNFLEFVWTSTRHTTKPEHVWSIHSNGTVGYDEVNSVFGIRPSVWQQP